MMRKLLLLIVLALVGFSCSRVFIEHDYKYTENFANYNTYAFVDCERDTSYICEDVQSAIERQMEARGYEFEPRKPNLLIHFSIYYDNLRYQGFEQPSLMNWVDTQDQDFTYRPIKYELSKGTIMISLLEADKGEVVWRGYATGIFNKNSKKSNYFNNVVRNIFDQYPLTTVKIRRGRKANVSSAKL